MSNSPGRTEYEFDRETKQAALEKYQYRCARCGGEETREDPFEFNHRLPIWFAKEVGGALPVVLIKSLANCEPDHRSCHHEYHREETRELYLALAPIILKEYLESIVDMSKDDWRKQLKRTPAGRKYEQQRAFGGHD